MKINKYRATLELTKVFNFKNEPELCVRVIDLLSTTSEKISYQHYKKVEEEIEGMNYSPSEVKRIHIDALSEEFYYNAEADIEISYCNSMDYWSGARETDIYVDISIIDYEKRGKVTDNSFEPEVYQEFPKFYVENNNGGNFIKIARLNNDKLLVHVAQSCVSRKFTIQTNRLCGMLMDIDFSKKD